MMAALIDRPEEVSDERREELDETLRQKALDYGFDPAALEGATFRWRGRGKHLVRLLELDNKQFTAGVNVLFNRSVPVGVEEVLSRDDASVLLDGLRLALRAREMLEPFGIDVRIDSSE